MKVGPVQLYRGLEVTMDGKQVADAKRAAFGRDWGTMRVLDNEKAMGAVDLGCVVSMFSKALDAEVARGYPARRGARRGASRTSGSSRSATAGTRCTP